MENIDKVFVSEDISSHELLLRVPTKTTGLDSRAITVNDIPFEIHTIGRTETQRQNWPKQILGSEVIICVVSLLGYCQPALEGDFAVRQIPIHKTCQH